MERRISGKQVLDGKVLKVRVDEVELDDGRKAEREIVHHPGGAAVLAVKDGKVLLERQFRYAVGREIIEIPAGKRDCGEEFIDTARRELEEETGLKAKNLKELCKIIPSPGYTDEVIAVFYADEFEKGETHFDDTEDLTSFWLDLDKAYAMLSAGEITDAKTVTALLFLSEARISGNARLTL